MASQDKQGTGKHPHKSTEEPYPHTKEQGRQGGEHAGGRGSHEEAGRSGGEKSSGGGDDLKSREYRDKDGNIHHHTRTAGKSGGKE